MDMKGELIPKLNISSKEICQLVNNELFILIPLRQGSENFIYNATNSQFKSED